MLKSSESSGMTAAIAKIALFEGLGADLSARIVRHCAYRRVPKGARLYQQGETPQALYYLVSGYLRRATGSLEGDEKVLDIVSPGQCCGLAELFCGVAHTSFAEAVKEAVVLEIGKAGLLHAAAECPPLALRITVALAGRQVALEQDVAANSFQCGARRLLDYLLREVGGALKPEGDTTFELPVPKSVIAARLGVTAETLSRSFRELSDAGLIQVYGKQVTILDKLARRRSAQAAQTAQTPPPPILERRRRRDPWAERATLTQPLGSRAWL